MTIMTRFFLTPMVMASLAVTLSACSGLGPKGGASSVIAIPMDRGFSDRGVLRDGQAAIVYDPDGCQGWLIDDGIEGYSGRRFDPVSGLPVCNNAYPAGTVLGNYQTDGRRNNGDWVPRGGGGYTTSTAAPFTSTTQNSSGAAFQAVGQ